MQDYIHCAAGREFPARGFKPIHFDPMNGWLEYFDPAKRMLNGLTVRRQHGGGLNIKTQSIILPDSPELVLPST